MKNSFFTLLKKEMAAYFTSYIGYVVIFLYLLLSGLINFYYGGYFSSKSINLESFFAYQSQIFMLIIPALLMRSISDEKKSGVFEVTTSFPIKIRTIVASKFFAAFFMSVLMLFLSIPFAIYSGFIMNLDVSIIICAYIMYVFAIATLCGISLLFSSFSSNSIVSYLLSMLALWIFINTEFLVFIKPISLISESIYFEVERALSFRTYFNDFMIGNIGLDSFIYFLSFSLIPIYLTTYMLETYKHKNMKYFCAISVLLFLLIIIINISSGYILSKHKLDVTSDKVHSLSVESKTIASSVPEGIDIKIYISKDLADFDYKYYLYTRDVIDFLRQYKKESNGSINIDIRIIKTGSLQEQEVRDANISPFLASNGMDFIYFGAVFTNSSGEFRTIPNFIPEKRKDLESDVSKIIHKLSGNPLKRIGWVNALEGNRDDTMIKGLISNEYDIINITPNTVQIPVLATDALVVTNFQSISYMLSYAIDQYVLLGGKVLFLIDNKNSDIENTFARDILKNMGIYYDYEVVVTDSNISKIVVGSDDGYKRYIKNITSLLPLKDNINYHSPIMRGIRNLEFNSPLLLKLLDDEAISLVETSGTIGGMPNSIIKNIGNEYISNNFNTINEVANLAILSTGKTSSIFYENIVSSEKYKKDMAPYIYMSYEDYKAIVVSSSSLIDVSEYVLIGDNLNRYSIYSDNDNLKFILNSLDYLSGDEYALNLNKDNMIYNDRSILDTITYAENEIYAEELFNISKEITLKEREIAAFEETKGKYFSMKNVKQSKLLREEVYRLKTTRKTIENKINLSIQNILNKKIAIWSLFLPLVEIVILFLIVKLYYSRKRKRIREIFNEK